MNDADDLGREEDRLADTVDWESSKQRSTSEVSEQIGPYKILQMIGRGGMGRVYLAEQNLPVKRRVALKVIKTDTPTKEIIARFEAERQALAIMDHTNIAKVLDAGITEDGRPYFAMELVKGIPITEYCDKNKLAPSERLDLFVQACKAIHHAHQKGIIHRDLKPSNILVTLYDGRPIAKVIDFGLAKALFDQTQLTDRTLFTQYGQVVGTLEYMSPEQAEFNAMDVDTRTDVYSLGVLLYELLTGSTPIGRERLRQEAFDRILCIIREEEAVRPSSRLSDSGEAIKGISEQRKTDPRKLSLLLKGELDWIAIKALEKDRTRRYDSAAALAEDVERFLAGDVIAARPPSLRYQLTKTVRKHQGFVAAVLAVATVMLIALACTTYLWSQSSRLATEKATEASRAREAEAAQSLLAKEAQLARDAEKDLRIQSQRSAAKVQLEKGLALANDGLISEGIGWMTRALRSSPATDSTITNVIRRNIAAWLEYSPTFIGAMDLKGDVGFKLAFNDDGNILALSIQRRGDDRQNHLYGADRLIILRIEDGQVLVDRELGSPINAMAYANHLDAFLIALNDGNLLEISEQGAELGRTLPTRSSLSDIEVATSGNVYVSDERGHVLSLSKDLTQATQLFDCGEAVYALSVSQRETLLLALADGNTVYAIDRSGRPVNDPFDAGSGYAYALDADRALVACSDIVGTQSSTVRVWNALRSEYIDSVQLTNNTNHLEFDRESGTLISTDKGLIVTGWDLREFRPLWQYSVPLVPITTGIRNSICATLSVGKLGTNVRAYRLPAIRRSVTEVDAQVSHRCMINDGTIAAWMSQAGSTIHYEDLQSHKICAAFCIPGTMALNGIDSKTFATTFNPNGVAVWDAEDVHVLNQAFLPESFGGMFGLKAFRDQNDIRLVVGGNMKGNWHVRLPEQGKPEMTSIGPKFFNYAIDWSPPDSLVAIGAHDGTVKLYDRQGQLVNETVPPLDAEVMGIDLNSDYNELIASTRVGTVFRLSFPELELLSARRGRHGPYPQWTYGADDQFVAGGYNRIEARDKQTLLQIGPRFAYENSMATAYVADGELQYASNVVAGTGKGVGVLQRQAIADPVVGSAEIVEQAVAARLGQHIIGEGGVTQLLGSSSDETAHRIDLLKIGSIESNGASQESVEEQYVAWKRHRETFGDKHSRLWSRMHGATRFVAGVKFDPSEDDLESTCDLLGDDSKAIVSNRIAAIGWGLNRSELQEQIKQRIDSGFRLCHVSEYSLHDQQRFCAVWRKSSFESLLELGVDANDLMQRHIELTRQGYRAVCCEPVAVVRGNPLDRFNMLWTKEPGDPTTLSLGTPDDLWNSDQNVASSWRLFFNQRGLRVAASSAREIGSEIRKNSAIWTNAPANWNAFSSSYLFEQSNNIGNDTRSFDSGNRPGLRRAGMSLSPVFPDGCWELIVSGQIDAEIWTGVESAKGLRSGLEAFFHGDFDIALDRLESFDAQEPGDQYELVNLFKLLCRLRIGDLNSAREQLNELRKSIVSVDNSTNRVLTSTDTFLPIFEFLINIDEANQAADSGSVMSKINEYVERLPIGMSQVDCYLLASLAVRDSEDRRWLQRRAVTAMERSGRNHQHWLRGVYGTLWETPEFQSFARRNQFDVLVSTVWFDRQRKQSVVAEALDYRTLVDECVLAMNARFVPRTVSIVERSGGRGIIAAVVMDRQNPSDWLSMTQEMATQRHAATWARKRAVQAVDEWVTTGDSRALSDFLQPQRPERGWAIRAISDNQQMSDEMYRKDFAKSSSVLMAMAASPVVDCRQAAQDTALRILSDPTVTHATTIAAARYVAAQLDLDVPSAKSGMFVQEEHMDGTRPLQLIGGHNGHELVSLIGGLTFPMGSQPGELGRLPNEIWHQRKLEPSKFAVGCREVTLSQFRQFREGHLSNVSDDTHPATRLSWYDATAYCNWLSQQAGLPENEWVYTPSPSGDYGPGMSIPPDWWKRKGYRLPTEVEWEYACRALSESGRPCGDSLDLIDDHCWTSKNSEEQLHPVAQTIPNYFGFFDMLGNASEWCHTAHTLYLSESGEPSTESEKSGVVPPNGPRSVRGGSAFEFYGNSRSAFRDYYPPNAKLPGLGFRVARTLSP